MWAVVPQNALDMLHGCLGLLLKARLWVLVMLMLLNFLLQRYPTYVLVNSKYLLTLRTKFAWHLTREMTLTHLVKIRLWVSVVVVLPAKYSDS